MKANEMNTNESGAAVLAIFDQLINRVEERLYNLVRR
jgi:hypothetical protein